MAASPAVGCEETILKLLGFKDGIGIVIGDEGSERLS